jgi:hypothetical protein
MWGRFSTCGRFSIGLGGSVQMPPRRVKNLPHKTCSISDSGQTEWRRADQNLPGQPLDPLTHARRFVCGNL